MSALLVWARKIKIKELGGYGNSEMNRKVVVNGRKKKYQYYNKRKEECCGCTACYAICPKEAISMVEDEEGFEYPQIDESKCVRCHQCIKVCPIKAARAQ